jgi:hypothetical protein
MAAPSAAVLMDVWDPAPDAPPHRWLAALLAATDGAEAIDADTLGDRNRRLLRLHRALVGKPLDARVRCVHCAAESEFALPVEAILATPVPAPDARAHVRAGRRTLSFRLPRMADIEAASDPSADDDVRRMVLEGCRIRGDGAIPDGAVERLGQMFETLDPAANITVNIACSGCARAIAASVDVATFVALDLDRLVDRLFRDIDLIASAYGWSEHAILGLAPERRRRYIAMITGARTSRRAGLAGRRA